MSRTDKLVGRAAAENASTVAGSEEGRPRFTEQIYRADLPSRFTEHQETSVHTLPATESENSRQRLGMVDGKDREIYIEGVIGIAVVRGGRMIPFLRMPLQNSMRQITKRIGWVMIFTNT